MLRILWVVYGLLSLQAKSFQIIINAREFNANYVTRVDNKDHGQFT